MTGIFKGRKRILSCKQELLSTPDRIFPLLCPVREYDWIAPWSCDLVFSESGFAESDCVFITDFPDDVKETWIVDRYEPDRLIQFIRLSESRLIRHSIELKDNYDGTTTANWTQTIVSLNDEGNIFIENLKENDFKSEIKTLEKMLNHYIRTNKMLEMSDI